MGNVVQSGDKLKTYFKRVPHYFWFYLFLVWFFFMSLALTINYYHGFVKESPYPLNSIFPPMKFGDFYGPMTEWMNFEGFGKSGFGMVYFPTAYLILDLILNITNYSSSASLQLSLLIWFFGGTLTIVKFLKKDGFIQTMILVSMIILGYPSIFILATGNFEGWIGFLLLLAGVVAFQNKWTSFAICIGIAGAIKGVPFIFLLLPLFVLKYRSGIVVVLKSITIAMAVTLYSLFVLPGGFLDKGYEGARAAIAGIRSSQEMYGDLMVNSIASIHYGHSFLNAVHSLFGVETLPSHIWGPIVFWSMIGTLIILLYVQKKSGVELWTQFLVISSVACTAVATSTDYKLIYLTPALLLASKYRFDDKYKVSLIFLTVFAIVPKPWMYVGNDPFSNASVYLTSATLLLMIGISFLQAHAYRKKGMRPDYRASITNLGRNIPRTKKQ